MSDDTSGQAKRTPPEAERLLKLIRLDFSLLKSAADKVSESFGSAYHETEFPVFPSGEPIAKEDVDGVVTNIEEGVRHQSDRLNGLIERVESEVNRLAVAFAERATPEEIRQHGYRRLVFGGERDWEPASFEEPVNPFGGDYWGDRVAIKDHPSSVRVDGIQYIVKDEGDHLPGFRGHGGREFRIEFDDGRLVRTTNLWLSGEIPERHKEQLSDNARFLDEAEFRRRLDELDREYESTRSPGPEEIAADLHEPLDADGSYDHDTKPSNSGADEVHRLETIEMRDHRYQRLLFNGAAMPEGWELPHLVSPPRESDPEEIRRAGEEIERLKATPLGSWERVPSDVGVMAAPGRNGTWQELSEPGKLHLLDNWIDWKGVRVADRAALTLHQLDPDALPPEAATALKEAAEESHLDWKDPRPTPEEARAINAEMRADHAAARVRDGLDPGTYQVWHADTQGNSPDFPESYTKAATVRAHSLMEAKRLTTHVDKPWQENDGVKGADGARSTTRGDVIVDPENQAHRVEAEGFRPIGRGPKGYDEMLKEFAGRGQAKAPEKDRER